MNHITILSRKFYCESINGPTFASNLSDFVPYLQGNTIEKLKFISEIEVKTSVLADPATEILFTTSGGNSFLTHPYLSWAPEGFKVGDTIKLIQGANEDTATITALTGMVMKLSGTDFTGAPLNLVSGTYYDDVEIYNTTIPTSCVFKYGVVKNYTPGPGLTTSSPDPYGSWLDGQQQAFYGDGITGSLTPLTSTMTSSSIYADPRIKYDGVAADDYTFTFTMELEFRMEFFIVDWITNFENQTTPYSFTFPLSYRLQCEYKLGTSSNDPNEFRIFTDGTPANYVNGSVGFVGKNFSNGAQNYVKAALAYTNGSLSLTTPEATVTTHVTAQIEKLPSNFAAGQKIIVYFSKAPTSTEYSNINTESWDGIHIFDSKEQTEGAAAVDSTVIQNLTVAINGTATLLDINLDLIFNTAQQALISNGTKFFLGISVADDSLPATTSDRMIVWMDFQAMTKDTDISGLIASNTCKLYTSEKSFGSLGLATSDMATWVNRLHLCEFTFTLAKEALPFGAKANTNITSISGQIVSRNQTTGVEFVLDNFDIDMGPVTQYPAGGAYYQVVNNSGYRDFKINPTANQNKWYVSSQAPIGFDATQLWRVGWCFIIPWQQWKANPAVPAEFYDALEEQNNLNFRTSNYDNTGDWDIFVRLLVSVAKDGVITQYGLYSTECNVKNFDEQPSGAHAYVATTKLKDQDGNYVDDIYIGEPMTIETTITEAGISGLSSGFLFAEHVMGVSGSLDEFCRLHSKVDWSYPGNLLKPLDGEYFVKLTYDGPGDKVIIESAIDETTVDPTQPYDIYTHFLDER